MSKTKTKNPLKMAIDMLYRKTAPGLLFEAIVFFILAAVLFISPEKVVEISIIVFGALLGTFGLYKLLFGLSGEKQDTDTKRNNILFGLLYLVVGAIFAFFSEGAFVAIVYLFAILFLIRGISAMRTAIVIWKQKIGRYQLYFVVSVLMVLIPVILICFPSLFAYIAMYSIAAMLVFYGVADLFMYFDLLKLKRKSDKA